MGRSELVTWDGRRVRVGQWRDDRHRAYLGPVPHQAPITNDTVRSCMHRLAERGYREVVTAALTPDEQHAFLRNGFQVHERLHLFAHDLSTLPAPSRITNRRAKRRDRPAVLDLDGRSFPDFWRLDRDSLLEALDATPSSRFRVVDSESSGIAAYAITGRAGRAGYLQRIAVDPASHRSGLGRALVTDALQWLTARRASVALVNTQESNEAAVSLYESLGFIRQREGLAVLSAPITAPS